MSLLDVRNLSKTYISSRDKSRTVAVRGVSFSIAPGEFVGLAGESGCGKSTLAHMLLGLCPATEGEIYLEGERLRMPYKKETYRRMQMIFQLPGESFDPRKSIGQALEEAQRHFGYSREEAKERVPFLLERVGLSRELSERLPGQLSGGECQRAAIARAIAVSPSLLVCDELTSALDVSVQAQIVELLHQLREELGLALLFISHDLALLQGLCERCLIMYQGELIEQGTGEELWRRPGCDYTRELFASVFDVEER